MSAQDKRAIVDKIFGFHILNQMRGILKGEVKRIKESLDILIGKIESTKKSIDHSNNEMESLLTEIEKESTEEISKLNGALDKFRILQTDHSKVVLDFKKNEDELTALIYDSNRNLIEARSKYHDLERRLKLYESDKCPTCESDLSGEHHEALKESLKNESAIKFSELEEYENTLISLKKRESDNRTLKSELSEKSQKIDLRIKAILAEIKNMEDKKGGKEINSLERIINKLESDKSTLEASSFTTIEKNNCR
jgi:chromosome segregation ATPase